MLYTWAELSYIAALQLTYFIYFILIRAYRWSEARARRMKEMESESEFSKGWNVDRKQKSRFSMRQSPSDRFLLWKVPLIFGDLQEFLQLVRQRQRRLCLRPVWGIQIESQREQNYLRQNIRFQQGAQLHLWHLIIYSRPDPDLDKQSTYQSESSPWVTRSSHSMPERNFWPPTNLYFNLQDDDDVGRWTTWLRWVCTRR